MKMEPSSEFQSVFEKLIENKISFYPKNRNLLIGISGGADSMALLTALHNLGYKLLAIHCNFHLRGEESIRDQKFVENLCHKKKIPLIITDFDVDKYRKEKSCSIETACRELRYNLFFSLLEKHDAQAVAIAHNEDDNIETFFLNLLRGAGTRGLKGMEIHGERVLRPMLDISREMIELYLKEINQDYIVDSTNLQSDFRRNFLRNEVLPLLRNKWPDVNGSISRAIRNLNSEWKLLNQLISNQFSDDGKSLKKSVIAKSVAPETLIYHFISRYGGNFEMAEEILESINSGSPERKSWILNPHRVILERDALVILDDILQKPNLITLETLQNTEENRKLVKKNPDQKFFYSPYPADFYIFRRWEEGDRIEPLGMKGSSLVSDIIKDAKLSVAQKESLFVAVDPNNEKIIWIPELKRSRHHLITPESDLIYLLTITTSE